MKRGRKTKPSAIKELQGNPGKREIVPDIVTPGNGPLDPPPFVELGEDGLQMWRYLSPILSRLNLFTVLDVMALARYCELWDQWNKARRFISTNGLGVPMLKETIGLDGKKGNKLVGFVVYPQAKMFSKLDVALSRKESEFGLTPAARTVVRALGTEKPKSAHQQIDDLLQLDFDE